MRERESNLEKLRKNVFFSSLENLRVGRRGSDDTGTSVYYSPRIFDIRFLDFTFPTREREENLEFRG